HARWNTTWHTKWIKREAQKKISANPSFKFTTNKRQQLQLSHQHLAKIKGRNAVYNQRVKRFPRFPRNRQDLIIVDEFRRMKFGKMFLFSESASKYIRVFLTENNRQSS
ncbi:hypothetical protein T4C_6452, partial [Trichinella pseudospiralis]